MRSVRNMKLDSVKSAVSASTSITVANVLIQDPTVNSEPSTLSGRCPETEGREKSRWGDGVTRLWGDGENGLRTRSTDTVTFINRCDNKDAKCLPLG